MNQSQRELIEQHAKPGETYEQAYARLFSSQGAQGVTSQSQEKEKGITCSRSALAPERHAQRDFFIADILDASPKDDTASMEHPLFALRAGNHKVRYYQHGDITVVVKPGHDGCATIHDKDVWIYCISQLMESINQGRESISRVVRFTAYDFLVSTNRDTSGRAYQRMGDALARLSGTRIETNIETKGKRERRGFGLIDSWSVIERDSDNRMVAVEVTLPEWLYRSVESKHVLTLSRDYFRLRKPLDRRIYELARKHCGAQPKWSVNISTLHLKSGSQDKRFKFRAAVKELAEENALPDYRVSFNAESDVVTFYARRSKGDQAQLKDLLGEGR
ncbi:plasmid replication initiator TrfA [Halomonas salifodinae]|uniref:Plasmid replication initiator TrfA n=1 Tax=Halomonas salifodinae TaxID=438745 RepID=A0ABW2F483_9GAMM